MNDHSPLLVPMTVEALVVNDDVRAPRDQIKTFMRTQMSYNSMQDFKNGQPFINGNNPDFTQSNGKVNHIESSQYYNGVYLKWRLPKAFTSGSQDNATGLTSYPLVPNRWLVIRYGGKDLGSRTVSSWIVESDYIHDDVPSAKNASEEGSLFALPSSGEDNTPVGVYIGRNVQLGSWSESGKATGLTAVGPGNPSFAVYQPHCNNVFSFIDPLDGQDDQTLSYLVLGWFSSAASDPLCPGKAVASFNTHCGFDSTASFTSTSAVEIQWSAGVLTANDKTTTYNIAAGTTGPMSAPTFIYLNPAVSSSTLLTTTTLATAQGAGCTLLYTAQPFFRAQLDALGWSTQTDSTDPPPTPTWCLLTGSVVGVRWQSKGLPPGGTPDGAKVPVSVAVGNTSVEALTALITSQAAKDKVPVETELLEAFQLNLLDILDKPDGAARLAEKLRASFFQRRTAGYSWSIVNTQQTNDPPSQDALAKKPTWLTTLNENQRALDEAQLELSSLQRQLYILWWKAESWKTCYSNSTAIDCLKDKDGKAPRSLTAQLDPTINGSLAQQVLRLQNKIAVLKEQVPDGSSPEELEKAIVAYSASQHLPATHQLKRVLLENFYLPNNPVVLLAGAGSSGIVQSPRNLQCRFPSQTVTGITINNKEITAATLGRVIPQPELREVSGVPWQPELITALVDEFYFIDPNNEPSLAQAIQADPNDVQKAWTSANMQGVYPKDSIVNWSANPWHPLLLFWQANYYPINYGTSSTPNWKFEGSHYTWNKSKASVTKPPMSLQGVIQLTPNASFNMKARLQQFLDTNPNLPSQEVDALKVLLNSVDTHDGWDLLSQQLDGFNEQLLLGTPGVFLSPEASTMKTTPSLMSLIGSSGSYPPMMPQIPHSGESNLPTSQFQPWRAGQFEFTNLVLTDEWGQALWPFDKNSYTKEIVYMPPDLAPILSSNSVEVTISNALQIESVSPEIVTAQAATELTVQGICFAADAKVMWNGEALDTTFVSATKLTALSPNGLAAGNSEVTVVSNTVLSNTIKVSIINTPGISSIWPDLCQAGMVSSDRLEVTVNGFGFTDGAFVTWNGTPVDTTVVNDTILKASVPAAFLFAAGTARIGATVGTDTTNTLSFSIVGGAAISSVLPSLISTGDAAVTLTVNGVGFESHSVVNWNGSALATQYVSNECLTATVPANLLTTPAKASITEAIGAKVLDGVANPLIQLPPALLQPAKLIFNLVSASNDREDFGPANPEVNPIAGWLIPNHLDQSLMAYSATGQLLGELSIGVCASGTAQAFWAKAPFSPYETIQDLAQTIPHFGPFLLALSSKGPKELSVFFNAIDETLWTTIPTGASFDQSMAVLIGRPLAMVRARLQFLLDGAPFSDPSWANTFTDSTCALAPPSSPVTDYLFGIQLGNVAQLDDGLIGYFVGDDYAQFNVVSESGASDDGHIKPIGVNGNYLYQSFDGTSSFVSMLVDPRASVHATTAILPDVSVSLPPDFTQTALNAMNITYRAKALLTDQQTTKPASQANKGQTTILTPVPKLTTGTWSWLELAGETGWSIYPTADNDTAARLTDQPPVLRSGMMQLSSTLDDPSVAP